MPRPEDTPDVKASKGLAYILRHGAEKEGLHIRGDGYIKLNDVLTRPKMRDVDIEMVLRLVEENAKKRFELFYGYDPSPTPPKKLKKGQQPKKVRPLTKSMDDISFPDPFSNGINGVDASRVDDVASTLEKTTLDTSSKLVELPLISLPLPSLSDERPDSRGEYFIRASQGHSIKLDDAAHLELVRDDEEGRRKVGLLVHGTKSELFDTLLKEGLSRMNRSHIHLAPALSLSDHRITPRPTSTLLVYLDLAKVIQAGIPIYVSANGVVLTPGDENGVVKKEYWSKVEKVAGGLERGTREIIWKDGQILHNDITSSA